MTNPPYEFRPSSSLCAECGQIVGSNAECTNCRLVKLPLQHAHAMGFIVAQQVEERLRLMGMTVPIAEQITQMTSRIRQLEHALIGPDPDDPNYNWVSALLSEYEESYDPSTDEDPDATTMMFIAVRALVENARELQAKQQEHVT